MTDIFFDSIIFNIRRIENMATKKSSSSKSTKSSSSSSSSSRKSSVWGLNKISFWMIVAVTFLYAVSLILSAIDANKLMTAVRILQGIATAIMIVIVAILAWRYVRPKPVVWKVLYIICLLIVIAGIIVPLCLG